MVWWLAAVGTTGPGPFYFTALGTYTVGRKDCTITIQTDKTISRLHAEISVEAAPLLGPAEKDNGNLPRCKIVLKDLSKFGTFVNKEAGSKPLNSLPDNVAALKEGDTITFGTNKAIFKLHYIRIVLCMSPSVFRSTKEVRLKAEAVGVYVFEEWSSHCTHLLVEEGSPVTDLVIMAVLNKKPVLSLEWLQVVISQSSPSNQLPSLSRYSPTLVIGIRGLSLPAPIAEPHARDGTLHGSTVLMEMGYPYHYRDMPTLVDAAGGAVKFFIRDNLKDVAGSVQELGVLLLPMGQVSTKDWLGSQILSSIKHLHQLSEEDLLRSILTAKFDPSPPSLSPCASVDTDETVKEEDPEVEDDSASSVPQEIVQVAEWRSPLSGQELLHSKEDTIVTDLSMPTSFAGQLQTAVSTRFFERKISSILGGASNVESLRSGLVVESFSKQPDSLVGAGDRMVSRMKREEAPVLPDEVVAEVIFSRALIVQKDSLLAADSTSRAVPNFKRFRKGMSTYGNSFSSLVPFAKEPYRESDYGREMGDYLKQEKKRKEAELLAEDLFNAEQLKRRRVTTAEVGKKVGP